MKPMVVVLPLLFLLSCAMVRIYTRLALRFHLFDTPGSRSSHTVPTPTGAGGVMVMVWLLFCVLLGWLKPEYRPLLVPLIPGGVMLVCIGFWDDLRPLGARWRIIVHFAAATLLLYGLAYITPATASPWWIELVKLLLIVWSINLFNFMDGTDGLAAGEGITVLLAGGLLTGLAGGEQLTLLIWALALCVAGFLVWNWPRASVFMGDSGSVFLGYSIAGFALVSERLYDLPPALWLIPYTLFWFDGGMTLMRRVLSREVWYEAHRSHAYQRLHHRAGWSHRRILVLALLLNLLLGLLAIFAYNYKNMISWALLLALLIAAGAYLWIERLAPMYDQEPSEQDRS